MDSRLFSTLGRTLLLQVLFVFFVIRGATANGSLLPDYDGSGHPNNAFLTADPLGLLRPSGGERNITVRRSGELGHLPEFKQFDTVDYYEFAIDTGNWNTSVSLRENPEFSMWLVLWNRNNREKPLCFSKGQANQVCGPSQYPAGRYVAEVRTEPLAAKGRKLRYDLDIEVARIPVGNPGSLACEGARSIGPLSTHPIIEGQFPPQDATIRFFSTYFEQTARLTFARFGGSNVDIQVRPRLVGGAFDDNQLRIFDPGFYCIGITPRDPRGYTDYKIQIVPSFSSPLQLERNYDESPPALFHYDAGYRENGWYGDVKYINYFPMPKPVRPIEEGNVYVVREWLRVARPLHIMKFEIAKKATLDLRVRNAFEKLTPTLLILIGSS